MVAKIDGKFFSIYDANIEYKVGSINHEKVMSGKKGGYYVYKDIQDAIFADVQFHPGGNFSAPRTIIKCICWGTDTIRYGDKKLCFSNLMAVEDCGLPMGYKANAQECIEQVINDK